MKESRVLLIAAMLTGFTAPALYCAPGSDAAAFLKIDAGARAAAMGGAFTAVADDASSIFYNPAGPALARNKEVMLAHNEWFQGLRNEHAAYLHPVSSRLTLFTGLTGLIIPALDRYDGAGVKTGSFGAMEGAAGAGFSWALRSDTFAGLFLKAVYQQADKQKALAYAADVGFIRNYGGNLRFGLSAQNIGTPMKLYKESFELPRTYRLGAAYRFKGMAWLTGEILKAGESDPAAAAGAEAEYAVTEVESVFGRLGYRTGRSKNTGSGIAAGLGLRARDIRVDYAFSPFGDLGDTHRVTLTLMFGKDRAALSFTPRPKPVGAAGSPKSAQTEKKPVPREKTKNDQPPPKKKKGKEDKALYFVW